jgi:NAD(P)-dependent dehydrogenase (short-subunit alcohol dehydrogenase family)
MCLQQMKDQYNLFNYRYACLIEMDVYNERMKTTTNAVSIDRRIQIILNHIQYQQSKRFIMSSPTTSSSTINQSSFNGKVALITGSSSGIGKATALELAKQGCHVVLTARHMKKLEEAEKEINSKYPNSKVLSVETDASKEDQVIALMEQVKQRFGRLDILVCNAGVNGVWAPIEELKVEEFDQTININLRGTFLTIKFAVPLMKEQDHGSIIIVSSINGNRTFSNTGATAYSTSKAGQVAMGRMLALELAKYRIRVNSVCPGAIETNIEKSTELRHLEGIRLRAEYPDGTVPLNNGKPGGSEQVATVIKFLASDDSSHVTGTEIYVDGSESLFAL